MTVESKIYPAGIVLLNVEGGKANVRVRWNIHGVLRDSVLFFQYNEAVIQKTIPASYTSGEQTITISTRDDVVTYLLANQTEVIEQAQMSTFGV